MLNFTSNKAAFGGAIHLVEDSKMFCMKNASILVHGNQAVGGGGIYLDTSCFELSNLIGQLEGHKSLIYLM